MAIVTAAGNGSWRPRRAAPPLRNFPNICEAYRAVKSGCRQMMKLLQTPAPISRPGLLTSTFSACWRHLAQCGMRTTGNFHRYERSASVRRRPIWRATSATDKLPAAAPDQCNTSLSPCSPSTWASMYVGYSRQAAPRAGQTDRGAGTQDLFDAGAMRFDPFAKPSNKMVALAGFEMSSLAHRRGRST